MKNKISNSIAKADIRKLRQLILRYPEIVDFHKISRHQKDIYDYIGKFGIVGRLSSDIAVHFKLSIQNTSVQLRNLWLKGYLEREVSNAVTGGKIYIYRQNLEER